MWACLVPQASDLVPSSCGVSAGRPRFENRPFQSCLHTFTAMLLRAIEAENRLIRLIGHRDVDWSVKLQASLFESLDSF
jgi:hypothetical protein